MSIALYYPQEKFSVKFQYTIIRPFCLIDQTILQLAQAGSSLGEAAELLGLPPRMVIESAFELLKENMLSLTADSLVLSSQGKHWASKLNEYQRGQIQQGEASVFYDWNLGTANTVLKLEEDIEHEVDSGGQEIYRLFDLQESEENHVQIQFGATAYDLEDWKTKVRNNLSCNIGDIQERLSIIVRSALRSALTRAKYTLYEMEPLDNLSLCYRHGYKIEPEIHERPEPFRKNVPTAEIRDEDWLLSADAHCQWLRQAMLNANSHLLIFSAHQALSALENIEADYHPTSSDSFLILGYPEEERRYRVKAEHLRHIADENSKSDMKLVVYDDKDGSVHLALGSFNWMQSYRPQWGESSRTSGDTGFEISVVLHSDRHASALDDVLKLLISQVKDYSDSADKSKLLIALGNLRKMLEERLKVAPGEEELASMVVFGPAITNEYGQAMRHAERRCIVLSHTLSESINPLRSLTDRQAPFKSSCFIAFSDMYSEDGSGSSVRTFASEEQVAGYIGRIKPKTDSAVQIFRLPGVHSRLIVNDDIVTVTSLNCLSARGAMNSAFGFRFRDPESAQMLEELFAKTYGHKQSITRDDDVAVLLQSLRDKGESIEDLAKTHPELLNVLKSIVQNSEEK